MPDTLVEGPNDTVLAERHGGVLVLTLNRPDRLNAWSDELEARYFELLDAAEDDGDVKAIVVTGAGKGFCAGADMADLQRADDADVDVGAVLRNRPRPRAFPFTVRKPLIAAINGAAAGLGLVEALYCDLRFAAPEAKLTTSFSRRGLIAEYGCSWLLARLVGPGSALDLLLSGRVVLGEEAHRLGLVDRLAPREELLQAAVAYAQELADNCSPGSMATIKAQIHADLQRPFHESVAAADELMIESFARPDAAEGVQSYLQRRPPAFAALPPRG